MQSQIPVLDYPSVDPTARANALGEAFRRALAGMFGLALLLLGLLFSAGVVTMLPWLFRFHRLHPNDASFGSDVVELVVISLLALVCDGVSVRWLKFANRSSRHTAAACGGSSAS
jgi:hypothetical protein